MNTLDFINECDNIRLYHIIIDHKQQYEVNQIVSFPFDKPRDFSHWKQYKQQAEILLEEERLKNWTDYPSRYDCLFVADSMEAVKNWGRNKYSKGAIFYLYELQVIDGQIVYLDTDWFEGLGENLSDGTIPLTHKHSNQECIESYWKGIPFKNEDCSMKEGLFYGKVKVISKVKMIYDGYLRQFSVV